jgi:lipopolysaccharide/colanic/teichoic acid biosynthesis glycosyltransferase
MPEPYPNLNQRQKLVKRLTDIVIAIAVGVPAVPVVLCGWLLAFADTGRNGFFVQRRIGRNGVPFKLVKLRTMRAVAGCETTVTTTLDPRLARIGNLLRKSKIDELPQLWNVLKGDMSLVGPRPDVEGFADRLEGPARAILELRPGITGPATLKYRNEEELLARQDSPELYNAQVIFPDKTEINLRYLKEYSWWQDVRCLLATIGLVKLRF